MTGPSRLAAAVLLLVMVVGFPGATVASDPSSPGPVATSWPGETVALGPIEPLLGAGWDVVEDVTSSAGDPAADPRIMALAGFLGIDPATVLVREILARGGDGTAMRVVVVIDPDRDALRWGALLRGLDREGPMVSVDWTMVETDGVRFSEQVASLTTTVQYVDGGVLVSASALGPRAAAAVREVMGRLPPNASLVEATWSDDALAVFAALPDGFRFAGVPQGVAPIPLSLLEIGLDADIADAFETAGLEPRSTRTAFAMQADGTSRVMVIDTATRAPELLTALQARSGDRPCAGGPSASPCMGVVGHGDVVVIIASATEDALTTLERTISEPAASAAFGGPGYGIGRQRWDRPRPARSRRVATPTNATLTSWTSWAVICDVGSPRNTDTSSAALSAG